MRFGRCPLLSAWMRDTPIQNIDLYRFFSADLSSTKPYIQFRESIRIALSAPKTIHSKKNHFFAVVAIKNQLEKRCMKPFPLRFVASKMKSLVRNERL